MGFFQDLKEDLSLAVNELLPNDEKPDEQADADQDAALQPEHDNAEAAVIIQEDPAEEAEAEEAKAEETATEEAEAEEAETEEAEAEEADVEAFAADEPIGMDRVSVEQTETVEEVPVMEESAEEVGEAVEESAAADELPQESDETINDLIKEIETPKPQAEDFADVSFEKEVYDAVMEKDHDNKQVESELEKAVDEVMEDRVESVMGQDVIDETAIVTKGMKVSGDISSQGSMDVFGDIKGNIEVLGKLNVAGTIEGNSNAAEVFSDAAHITGDIHATGSIKVGLNSVIIGNIYATSAVIAGAIKGDIDVHGPVVLDSSAIVMGNIKSKSVQMNNGAVIEGLCSQCYADVSPAAFFKDIK